MSMDSEKENLIVGKQKKNSNEEKMMVINLFNT
jgi:hypothetical protein